MKQDNIPTMAVFGHPNHELALFGVVQRWHPAILVLTDGGGPYRVPDTMKALQEISHHAPVEILPFKEESFYRAILEKDVDFFRTVSAMIRDRAIMWDARRLICDAVEFFNPIHDIVRPLVESAMRDIPRHELLEAPITYQKPDGLFEFQRALPSRKAFELRFALTTEEYHAKVHAWEEIYVGLRELIGPLVGDAARFRFETLVPAQVGIPTPNGECSLYYERRGKDLQSSGKVEHVITHEAHYRPLVQALL